MDNNKVGGLEQLLPQASSPSQRETEELQPLDRAVDTVDRFAVAELRRRLLTTATERRLKERIRSSPAQISRLPIQWRNAPS
jgi:hypothetical protein